jgi:hypothetical protein
MRAPRLTKNSTLDEMGLGWHLRPVGGTMTAAHGGTLNGHCLHVQLVPTRNLAFVILTNHTDGWRLVQDVEHAILRRYAGVALTPNQAIGHRGVNEAMTFHSKPLAAQPSSAEYVGTYQRPPVGTVEVRTTTARSSPAMRGWCLRTRRGLSTSGGYVGTCRVRAHARWPRRLDSRQRPDRAQGLSPGEPFLHILHWRPK